ncbi:hypothetical protein [Streptomyces poonensis]|uniref:Uncharacterized protein n=1 Tax=Streptomyces poonensis TaxID=68255 RepID=A0A918UDD5_9ACTN|nr:hypothetical protein [Streptomyces poonensis]GGY96164.1 hypothetical protein GCM10010365_13840 [Streptomyces poonensis]GLJ88915.1 hypothetical protein GCM10017589_15150 [Streptomyces poonensis]
MTDEFMGPPWQMDWRLDALVGRDALPDHVRRMVDEIRAELVTAKDPYFRGVDTDGDLPETMYVEPVRSSDPKGPRIVYFDNQYGWLVYTFVRRSADPQIMVIEVFWQAYEPPTESPAEP